MTEISKWINYLTKNPVSIFPLIVFRISFGLILFISTLRFILKGWVTDLYIKPTYFFTYYGFDWINPVSNNFIYIAFFLLLVCSLMITFGLFYRYSSLLFFILFTYIELIDKTNYLNHYYFISLISFLMIFLPANRFFSVDNIIGICNERTIVKAWQINIIKLQVGIVYLFAGIAKLNYHWLIEAQPLTNWLKHQSDFPIIGNLFLYDNTAYLFSWAGAIFDLVIFFVLANKKYRIYGYVIVVVFHILTSIMFPIGVFPLVMIVATLIFFSDQFHQNVLSFLGKKNTSISIKNKEDNQENKVDKLIKAVLISFFILQLLIPFRYLLYPGKLFWTEQGYRFSWRVMLIEKAGYAQFYIHEPKMKRKMLIETRNFLTPQQEKMMSTQPDMILQFAHYISSEFKDSTILETNGEIIKLGNKPKITAEVKVSLFNKGSKDFINQNTNLSIENRGFMNKEWILPYED
ncbi:MAG: HTTM domain-containing protein [Parvicellaceae bacterium]